MTTSLTATPAANATSLPAQAGVLLHGDTALMFPFDPASGQVGLQLVPAGLLECLPAHRAQLDERAILALPEPWRRAPAWQVEGLVQVSCTGDERPAGYAQGRTMRGGGIASSLRFAGQEVDRRDGELQVTTVLDHASGLRATHRIRAAADSSVFGFEVSLANHGRQPVWLEMASSFSIMGISPFDPAASPGRLRLHRLRSVWSAEARHVAESAEDLHLERAWQPHSVACERFGQVGILPCRGWMPLAAIEDEVAGVTWAAQLACGGSWQMEFYRRGDFLALSGGLADREFGHWLKRLDPGEELELPRAAVTVTMGGFDAACRRLVRYQDRRSPRLAVETDLPVVCNEFCSSWGNPTAEGIGGLAGRLQGSGVRYLVIDAGWYAGAGRSWFDAHGDWAVSDSRFPGGLPEVAAMIRRAGMIPGIWFEPETVGADSEAYRDTSRLLHRDGFPLTVAKRRFWDLRRAEVREHVLDRLLRVLRCGFGYLKIDCNETIGVGPDGPAAPGEELRLQVAGIHALLDALRAAMPELVVEICASGGHRLEPTFLERSAMASFSDAHETEAAPIIAAQLHRCLPARQNQIWAVVRPEDDPGRQIWALCTGFLGRLCLSGQLDRLAPADWARVEAAVGLYRRVAGIIAAGESHLFGRMDASWTAPRGWQALRRLGDDGRLLVVAHGFAPPEAAVVPLPPGRWRIAARLDHGARIAIDREELRIAFAGERSAAVILLEAD